MILRRLVIREKPGAELLAVAEVCTVKTNGKPVLPETNRSLTGEPEVAVAVSLTGAAPFNAGVVGCGKYTSVLGSIHTSLRFLR
jgi:hypothetical protein